MSQGLILYDSARDALQECKFTDEVKDWADRAAATQAYARMAKDKSLEVDAAEIRIRAERRLGEMLAEQKASGNMASGHRFAGGSVAVPPAPTLAEAGIDKKLSARAQKIAAVPKAEFEAEVEEWRGRVSAEGERVTARLESSGEKHQRDSEPSSHDEVTADLLSDLEVAMRIIEADDKLNAAWDECKALARKLADLEGLYSAKCVELATMTKEAKRWKKRADALGPKS